MLEAMPPHTEYSIVPHSGLLSFGKWVVLDLFHLSEFHKLYGYSTLFVFCKTQHMAQLSTICQKFGK